MMRRILILAISLVLVLTACQGDQLEDQVESETTEVLLAPTDTAEPIPTEVPPTATSTTLESEPTGEAEGIATEDADTVKIASAAECTVVSIQPTPDAQLEALFGPDPETDWIYGPETAAVTIVEYGDFQ